MKVNSGKKLIYEVKCSICESIYIGNTQQTFKKRMDGQFSNLVCFLKDGKRSDSFATYFEQHFNSTAPHTDLRKCTTFKVVKQTLNWFNEKNTKPS